MARTLEINVELMSNVSRLNARIAEQTSSIAKLNERVSQLLAIAQRKQRKPVPSKLPEPPPVVEGEAKEAFESRPKPPELPLKEKAKQIRPPPTGRKALPAHLPVEGHDLKPEACDHCGSTELEAADEIVEENLHVVKEHQRRRVVGHHVPLPRLRWTHDAALAPGTVRALQGDVRVARLGRRFKVFDSDDT